ncbi:immunoglobulin-like domain-containing protein [uncultured Kordia sp.]|uniref:immunoglobulin-like domain-containing protein n=1 Tax=uncultured Kordia sp. TaxID=507699 RepID=UPI002604A72C|nr:immunoglobulin-like domain-containing protein [uncultured Kordia sp.]
MKKILHLVVLCLLTSFVQAQTPGVSIFYEQTAGDTRNYIEYIPGNLPIIISAPHGGVQQSGQTIGGIFYPDNDSSLPDRGCGTNERDDNTDILVREIQNEIFQLTGCYAHVIINNLHRSKLDPNREINEATCGNSNAADHWSAFHNFIDQASTAVESNWGKGLYIDLHGQSHSVPRIEAGYNVTSGELNSSNLNAANIINKSTIRNLVNTNLNNLSHEELIRGNNSLGELFQNAAGTFYASQGHAGCGSTSGYRAVPSATNNGGGSCDDTRPNGNAYFDGDFYNNRRHGSGNGTNDGTGGAGTVDGIMTEVNRRVRDLGTYNGQVYDSRPQTLVPFAKDYAATVLNYIDAHYNDFAMFTFLSTTYIVTNPNPTPVIAGISGGTFSSPSGLIINPATGEIDLANSPLGSHSVVYTVGTCGYYSLTRNITIVDDVSGDVTPPTDPSNLVASNVTETTTDLTWTTSTDDMDVIAYDIYQNDVIIASVAQLNYIVTGLTPNTAYEFKIIARDLAGNASQPSNVVNITTDQNVVINYCGSQSNNVDDEYISRVQLEDIDNTSDAQFYSDFTNISTELIRNGQYTITVTPTWTGTVYNEAYAVWIDYNQNGDFSDPGEQVWTQGNTTAASVSGTFTIPTAVPNGATRMRVSMKYNAIPTACETFTYGEVEDYTVNIMSSMPDTIPPVITLNGDNPVDIFVGDTYVDAGATAIDNIDGDVTNDIIVTGTVNTAVAGTYTIRYNVRDVVGNNATEVTRTVNVITPVDTTAPVITLNGESTLNLNVGDFYTELGATATDNVDGNLTSAIIITGNVNTAIAGTYTIRYNVSDIAGNAATEVTRTINVVADTVAPVISLNGSQTINLNINEAYVELGATAIDNVDGNLTPNINISGTIDTSTAGTYLINYTVSDATGNTAQITRTVNVLADTIAPIIVLNGNATINLNVGEAYTELGATATDNLDGNLTNAIVITGTVDTTIAGTYSVNYTVSDSSGNTTQVTRTVNVIADTTAPIITLNGNATIDLNVGEAYIELGAIATDNLDGNLTNAIVITGTVNTAVAGTYQLTYSVSDAAGNTAQVIRTVNVLADTTAPIITLNGNATIDLNVGEAYTELGATATDNLDGNLTNAIVITGTVNTAVAGTYTVRYNVSDTAGNAATEVTRTVIVNEVSIGCTNGIDTFPYSEGFENSLGGWTQSSADDIDWTILSNATPSQNTGPSSAIEGNFYAYVEASGNGTGYPDKQAILTSPCFDLTSLTQATFSFNYHMYGTDMGTLAVEISEDNGANWTTIWNQTGNQGNAWQTTNIDLGAYVGNNVQLRFNRVTGSTWRADIAIDNINLIDEEIIVEGCSGGINTFPYTESYENTLGGWTQSSADDINWTVDSNGTPSQNTGPSNAANGNFYIFVEASGNGTGFPNKQAIINSPCYDLTNELNASFSFSYHMFGSNDMGTIALEASNDNGLSWITIWSESGNKGNQWLSANVDLSSYIGGSVQLRFNRITGGTWQADIAIDNINLDTTTLPRQQANNAKEDITTDTVTDGNEIFTTKNNLTVYPNPVRGNVLNIKLNFGAVTSYRIINLYGQEVAKGKEANHIKVGNLRSGVYFVEVFDGKNTLTKKFMKQ